LRVGGITGDGAAQSFDGVKARPTTAIKFIFTKGRSATNVGHVVRRKEQQAALRSFSRDLDEELNGALDDLADEIGTVAGQHDRKIFELLGIVQALADSASDDFIRGRVDRSRETFDRSTRSCSTTRLRR
jgi:hypothetical protein